MHNLFDIQSGLYSLIFTYQKILMILVPSYECSIWMFNSLFKRISFVISQRNLSHLSESTHDLIPSYECLLFFRWMLFFGHSNVSSVLNMRTISHCLVIQIWLFVLWLIHGLIVVVADDPIRKSAEHDMSKQWEEQ